MFFAAAAQEKDAQKKEMSQYLLRGVSKETLRSTSIALAIAAKTALTIPTGRSNWSC